MFSVAPYSPAATPPLPPLPESAPPPLMYPTPPAPPVTPPPSPETLLVQDSPPPSPVPPLPLTVPSFPSPSSASPMPPFFVTTSPPSPFPFATAPATTSFPPSPPTPTAAFPPALPEMPPTQPATAAMVTVPPLPLPPPFTTEPTFATPWFPALPAPAPEVNVASTTRGGSLPVAVDVEKPSTFHVSSGLIVGLVIGIIIFVFVFTVGSVLRRINRKKNKNKNLSTPHYNKGSHVIRVPSNPPPVTSGSFNSVSTVKAIPNRNHGPRGAFGPVNGIFTYDELLVATRCFSESNLLGEGGFGYVYKGVLPCGKEIAVKQLKSGSQQGEREFQAEVETISRVHHKHLVELVGYSVTNTERLLVYEFVPNNTLEFHLHGEGNTFLEWSTRIKIALGAAKGMAYLHEGNPAIIHRDIKASNILLDFKFEPKVSDFGLAKIFPNNTDDSCISHLTTRVMGTFGYLAPEYASSGKLTDKSDVYSYGIMLLELITGRPPITTARSRNESLVDWARPLLAQALQDGDFDNLVDPRLQITYEADEMERMITCAAACVSHSARLRPRMSQIVGALEGVVSLTDLVGDVTPEHNTVYDWSNILDYDDSQYQQDMRNFNLPLSCHKYSSNEYSETTSAYGLHPSGSSSEAQQSIRDIV